MAKISKIVKEASKRQHALRTAVRRNTVQQQLSMIKFLECDTIVDSEKLFFVFYAFFENLQNYKKFYFFKNRCNITGKSRGFYRQFGICRNMLHKMAWTAVLPGVTKSSW
jgi:small subunit ribosomal protein S14